MSAEQSEWWGYSQEHSWVVLDRDDPRNRPAAPIVHFLRCSDSAEIAMPRDEWEPPTTISAANYLASIQNDELRSLAERQLQLCRKQYDSQKAKRLQRIRLELREHQKTVKETRDTTICSRHQKYLEGAGLPAKRAIRLLRFIRHTGCWSCKTPINSADDLGCDGCKGIICHHCGACLCGRS
jgi:hypothetical protein